MKNSTHTTLPQEKVFTGSYLENGQRVFVTAFVHWDDRNKNGHNTFSITGETRLLENGRIESCGCLHDEIVKAIPRLAPFIKWHLVSADGPMHYESNTVYLAGDRDCWGLKKGEKRQIRNGRTGLPCWILEAVDSAGNVAEELPKYVDAESRPEAPLRLLKYVPLYRIGEGKGRELEAARSAAVWPDATDEELCAEPEELRKKLRERLPALMEEFQKAVESLGFTY